jgi:PAS domain-containing protein
MTSDDISKRVSELKQPVQDPRAQCLNNPDQADEVLSDAFEELEISLTERKQAEEALQEGETRLRLAEAAGQVGSFEWNIQTGTTWLSPEFQSIYGLDSGSYDGTYESWAKMIHPDDRPKVEAELNAIFKQHIDGSVTSYDANGEPLKSVGVNLDITERKKMEMELSRARDELEQRVQERTDDLLKANKALRIR